ncbi:hypothetical protein BDW66DRAFT_123774 [Aspergillus desertorum]
MPTDALAADGNVTLAAHSVPQDLPTDLKDLSPDISAGKSVSQGSQLYTSSQKAAAISPRFVQTSSTINFAHCANARERLSEKH